MSGIDLSLQDVRERHIACGNKYHRIYFTDHLIEKYDHD